MNGFIGWGLSITLLALGLNIPAEAKAPVLTVSAPAIPESPIWPHEKLENIQLERHQQNQSNIAFTHGNISWLSALALEAGWPIETHERLGQIILRESGGCPNRRGGDAVDENCNVTHVTEWSHRSDTGLLQINGVNYNPKRNKWALACRQLGVCTQKPLLDPLINLKVGYLLYQVSGWGPWDPCTWGKEFAHRCVKSRP